MPTPSSLPVLDRMCDAINAHDLEALTDCFSPDYDSEFPAHPDRIFRGQSQMRANWAQIFGGVPDIRATLVRGTADGETAWAEWEWRGTRREGGTFAMRGVTIQGVRDGRIAWVRLYMEPVEAGRGTDAAVRELVSGEGTTDR